MSLFKKAKKSVKRYAKKLHEKSPFLFSHLPAPIKKSVFDDEVDYAKALAKAVAENEAKAVEKRKKVEGLRLQLADQRTQSTEIYHFARTNARDYGKFTR